jgi:enamine deaminase RidA (YjgF/YER057c/UK114 family)
MNEKIKELADQATEVFDNIDGVIKTAVNNYCKTL